ncbi:Uncharacterized protein HZ326_9521 [Fusarium oxysporum f. sp. albedinis]|nr:Uncharacterized protein HZ326_9521 [Fusarium oxysporum f. sp. albedinis]
MLLAAFSSNLLQIFLFTIHGFLTQGQASHSLQPPSFSISSRSRMNSDRIGPTKVQRPTLMDSHLVSPRPASRFVAFLTSQLLFRLEFDRGQGLVPLSNSTNRCSTCVYFPQGPPLPCHDFCIVQCLTLKGLRILYLIGLL